MKREVAEPFKECRNCDIARNSAWYHANKPRGVTGESTHRKHRAPLEAADWQFGNGQKPNRSVDW